MSEPVLRAYRKAWEATIVHALDEISFMPPDMFFQIEKRSGTGKRKEHSLMGGLCTLLSGDFLQLPPVEGSSLARPLDEKGFFVDASSQDKKIERDERHGSKTKEERDNRERRDEECRGGFALWRNQCRSVTNLSLNMRTTQPLAGILSGMRNKKMTDESWRSLEDRLLGCRRSGNGGMKPLPPGELDDRLSQPPFVNNPVVYIVHRHKLRACQSYRNAVKSCVALREPLYLSVARDETTSANEQYFTDEVRRQLLEKANLRHVKNLPGTLVLYRGLRLLLQKKICVQLSLVNGCECILEDIVFSDDERLPEHAFAGALIVLEYMPTRLLLRAVGAQWVLPSVHLPHLPDGYDRKGLFLLKPHYDELTEGLPCKVLRTHFPIVPADVRIVHSAQGEGFEANIVDMAKPPTMGPEEHWLSNYVMISRASSLEGLLILRLPSRADMTRGSRHLYANRGIRKGY